MRSPIRLTLRMPKRTKRPADPCPGLELGLADVDLLGVIAADNSGAISRDEDVGVNACGLFVQAVDLVTRGPSNVASVP